MWTEHRNPEGRTYWFNTATKQSVWEKPDDLKTPFERALNQTKWKEYFSGGRKYYYNTESKESKWDMPDELLLLLEKVEKEGQTAANAPPRAITAPSFTPVAGVIQGGSILVGGTNPSSSTASQTGLQNGVISTAVGAHTSIGGAPHSANVAALPLAANTVLPARPNLPDDPVIPHNGFQTVEEGEKAFIHLLRKAGVDANWTWDQTMRAIITDPLYKALNTLAEKKACWEKYTTSLKQKEQEDKEARLAKLRPAIRNMLKGNPNVFYYTTFPTADKTFSQHPIWQQARIEAERKIVFEEYVTELKEREVNETRTSRSRSFAKVVALFKDLDVDVLTRWREAYERLTNSEEWKSDSELRKLPSLDILLAFEDYNRVREREYEEQMRRQQVEKTRKERKAREAFRELLQELVQDGKIKARTKWKEIYPTFRDDRRYLNMLGHPGSNPLELFWDVVDAFDQKLDKKILIVEDAIKRYNEKRTKEDEDVGSQGDVRMNGGHHNFSVVSQTTWSAFCGVVDSELDAGSMTEEELRMVYKTLHDAAVKKHADDKRRAERKQRHLQDDLRYAIKKLSEPIDINTKYEDAVTLIEHLPEFKALEDEDGRRAAFAKYVRRQKERMRETGSEDGASTTSRKRKEPARDYRDREDDRDKERDRERDRGEKDKREKDSHRERDRDRDRDRGKDYERSKRHHHSRYEDYEDRKASRDYDKEREYKSSSTKYHREDREEKDRDRDGDKEKKREREGKDKEKREKNGKRLLERERSNSPYEEKTEDSPHAEKRARYDLEDGNMDVDKRQGSARDDTPEEGEI